MHQVVAVGSAARTDFEGPTEAAPVEPAAASSAAAPVEPEAASSAAAPVEPKVLDMATDEQRVSTEIDADLAAKLGRPKLADAPTGALGKLMAGRSMLGLASERAGETEEEELSDTSGLDAAYDEVAVMKAWDALVADVRGQNKMGLAATLATGEKRFEDPCLILTVANQVQYGELKECATGLLHFLRTQVGNGSLSFEVEVAEEAAATEFLTPKDRYHRWADAHPALETLRNRLDLDLG